MRLQKPGLSIALATAVAILAAFGPGARGLNAQQTGFSLASLKGDYVLTERGTVGSSSIVAVGRFTFDGSGGVSGWQTVQSANSSLTFDCSGSYMINPDGSGTFSVSHSVPVTVVDGEDSGTEMSVYKFFALSNGTSGPDLRAIRGESGEAISTTLTKAVAGTTVDGLKGAYILAEDGTSGSNAPLVGLGMIMFDGLGGVTGWETTQFTNTSIPTTFTGAYWFDATGVGMLSLTHTLPSTGVAGEDSPTQMANYKFLVVGGSSGAKELRALRSDNGLAVNSTIRSQ